MGLVGTVREILRQHGLLGSGEAVSLIVGKGRQGFRGNVVFWVFTGSAPHPAFWGKTSRTKEGNPWLESEYKTLTELGASPLRPFVPAVHALGEWQGRKVLIEEFVRNDNELSLTYNSDLDFPRDRSFRSIDEFLWSLASLPVGGAGDAAFSWTGLRRSFRELHTASDKQEEALDGLDAFWKKHASARCYQHGDLWRTHVLRTGARGIKVIDWEFSRSNGFPISDAFQLFLSMAIDRYRIQLSTDDYLTAIRQVAEGRDEFSRYVQSQYRRLAERAMPGEHVIRELLLTHLIFESIRDHAMLLDCSRDGYLSIPPSREAGGMTYAEVIKRNRYYTAFQGVVAGDYFA
ncbi:MAG: hypothetical protein QME74_03260 [Candidatus Edwardsbacteria bacterium]|nr:hypothetical protein [Candidatus Edwardsbacteria bacterium]